MSTLFLLCFFFCNLCLMFFIFSLIKFLIAQNYQNFQYVKWVIQRLAREYIPSFFFFDQVYAIVVNERAIHTCPIMSICVATEYSLPAKETNIAEKQYIIIIVTRTKTAVVQQRHVLNISACLLILS